MKNLGLLHYCLGAEVWQTNNHIFVSQTKYVKRLLESFKMADCKISSTPIEKGLKLPTKTDSKTVNESIYKQLMCSLIYLTVIRPNLSYTVCSISQFMQAPKKQNTGQHKEGAMVYR
jgi:hypothetical protein